MSLLASEGHVFAVSETPFLPQPAGQLTVYVGDSFIRELAMNAAADLVSNGENLIVIDGANSFDPYFISRIAQARALDPAALLGRLHISRAFTCHQLEETILTRLEPAFERFQTRYALISGLLDTFYDQEVPTREAARLLGRVRFKLEALAGTVAQIAVLCYRPAVDVGTRSHFLLSLYSSADRVFEAQHQPELKHSVRQIKGLAHGLHGPMGQ